MHKNPTTLNLPTELRQRIDRVREHLRCGDVVPSMSRVAAEAIARGVEAIERERGLSPAPAPNPHSNGGPQAA